VKIQFPINRAIEQNRGFSLIEILVVMTILGATVMFVALGFQRLEDDRLEKQAGQLSAWLQLVSDDAVLDSALYGVWLGRGGAPSRVGFFFDNRWWPVNENGVRPAVLEATVAISVRMGEHWRPITDQTDRSSTSPGQPDMLFLPTGMALPDGLELRFEERTARVERDRDGMFVWSLL